jgi:hypothetical protein
MIHNLWTPELLVIPSLAFTMRLGEPTSRYGPAKHRTKRRHTLRFHAGKGELARSLSWCHRLINHLS